MADASTAVPLLDEVLQGLDLGGTGLDVVGVRSAVEIETAVQSAGGAAAALRSPEEWRAHPQSTAVAARPLVELADVPDAAAPASGRPLRVLDITRVIAGPTATKVLAA